MRTQFEFIARPAIFHLLHPWIQQRLPRSEKMAKSPQGLKILAGLCAEYCKHDTWRIIEGTNGVLFDPQLQMAVSSADVRELRLVSLTSIYSLTPVAPVTSPCQLSASCCRFHAVFYAVAAVRLLINKYTQNSRKGTAIHRQCSTLEGGEGSSCPHV